MFENQRLWYISLVDPDTVLTFNIDDIGYLDFGFLKFERIEYYHALQESYKSELLEKVQDGRIHVYRKMRTRTIVSHTNNGINDASHGDFHNPRPTRDSKPLYIPKKSGDQVKYTYVFQKGDQLAERIYRFNYSEKVVDYVKDCPEFAQRHHEDKYLFKHLEETIQEYNEMECSFIRSNDQDIPKNLPEQAPALRNNSRSF